MKKTIDPQPALTGGDLVLQEIWRAKDTLSAAYGHDLDKLFAETREHEKTSGHPIAKLQPRKPRRRAVTS